MASGVYEKTIQIPMEWCEAMPNATSAIASAKIERKSGSAVSASGTKSFMVTVPQDVKPTANALTWERTTGEGFPSGFDSVHIQNRTGISMTASAEGVYGSTIVSYTFTCKKGVKTLVSATQTGTNATYTINPITSAGELTFLVRATDSRGRKSEEKSISLNVLEYHLPIFQTISAYRCDASGIAAEEGAYIHASATVNAADIAEGEIANSLELSWAYRRHGDEEWIDSEESKAAVSTEEDRVFGGGQIDPLYTYQVRLTATDRFGSVSRTVNVSTATCSLFVLEGGNGIGLGKICENENSVEINPNWQLRCGDFTFHPVYFGRTAPNNPCEGLVWLQPKE